MYLSAYLHVVLYIYILHENIQSSSIPFYSCDTHLCIHVYYIYILPHIRKTHIIYQKEF